ncbi:LysR family transcriptional regulator [Paenibacillus radicis (ex Gao et al. 2016)]|uniref:HTH-type transcriptional regulator GltR n=1 Tax=Paenibacillus radicis (ex Gao et al. 2016) TaxID=1737354 RepID=A0A917GUX1_9BACL|nr:LysR family transcriptional regulator [Paenibacillus radicis (ex Gao et al. 2016)]GGG58086.1 HTH-type transcriptional regulator GltR [Paenibacillus radicis (ex Gao et al. 2016)]
MEIRDMHIFLAVANEGSITRAAEKLEYVQSSISIRIQQLENELHTVLFIRQRQGVQLTTSGQILKSYVEKILSLTQEAIQVVSDRSTPQGPLRIGCLETTAAIRLPNILADYHRSYPEVDLTLKTGTTDELTKLVLKFELDGAFVSAPIEHEELETTKIGDEELVLVTGGQNVFLGEIEELQNQTLLVFRIGCSYRQKYEDWLGLKGLRPSKIMEFGTVDGILGCIHAGLGISLLPRSVVERASAHYDLHIQKIAEKAFKTATLFIRRKDSYSTPAVSELMRIAKERFT